MAGHRRHPRRGLDDVVERGIVTAVQSEPRQRDADDTVIERPQRVVGEPQPLDRRRLHIDQQRMRIRDQLTEAGTPFV